MTSTASRIRFLFYLVIFGVCIYFIHGYASRQGVSKSGASIMVDGKSYRLKQISGHDNNCMMRCIADQYNRTHSDTVHHLDVRRTITREIKNKPQLYDTDARTVSIDDMKKSGTQGGHMELVAAANYFKRPIHINDVTAGNVIKIPPKNPKHTTPWVLNFTSNGSESGHYDSLVKQ